MLNIMKKLDNETRIEALKDFLANNGLTLEELVKTTDEMVNIQEAKKQEEKIAEANAKRKGLLGKCYMEDSDREYYYRVICTDIKDIDCVVCFGFCMEPKITYGADVDGNRSVHLWEHNVHIYNLRTTELEMFKEVSDLDFATAYMEWAKALFYCGCTVDAYNINGQNEG